MNTTPLKPGVLGMIIAIALAAVAVQTVPAQSFPAAGAATSPTPSSKMISGEIVSASSSSVTIKDTQSDAPVSVAVNTSTVVTVDGRGAKLSDLKSGYSATITTAERDGRLVAVTISARA